MKNLDATDQLMHLLVGLPFRSTDPLEAPKYDLSLAFTWGNRFRSHNPISGYAKPF
jgi:hypothetical protein